MVICSATSVFSLTSEHKETAEAIPSLLNISLQAFMSMYLLVNEYAKKDNDEKQRYVAPYQKTTRNWRLWGLHFLSMLYTLSFPCIVYMRGSIQVGTMVGALCFQLVDGIVIILCLGKLIMKDTDAPKEITMEMLEEKMTHLEALMVNQSAQLKEMAALQIIQNTLKKEN